MRFWLVTVGVGIVSGYDCCWCDADTPAEKHQITFDKKQMQLVFSDEFNNEKRAFGNGKDAKWTALDVGDTSNQGTAFYLPEQACRSLAAALLQAFYPNPSCALSLCRRTFRKTPSSRMSPRC
tara:strand:+ start:271 stop:639 length:369 start_codon:yes stop_codon:yes gene_type:complete